MNNDYLLHILTPVDLTIAALQLIQPLTRQLRIEEEHKLGGYNVLEIKGDILTIASAKAILESNGFTLHYIDNAYILEIKQ